MDWVICLQLNVRVLGTFSCGWTLLRATDRLTVVFSRPASCGVRYDFVASRMKITEGVRAAVLACVENSTNSEGRIVEVNAFADFFAKAMGESTSPLLQSVWALGRTYFSLCRTMEDRCLPLLLLLYPLPFPPLLP